jgi:hypothetical protein
MFDPVTNLPIIILRDKDGHHMLPIWMGVFEANAIAMQIENVASVRPTTHDLLKNVIEDLNAVIKKIVVHDLKDNTFYAFLYLEVNGETVAIDARPSDAIALALRASAPIFIDKNVVENAQQLDLVPDKSNTEQLQQWLANLTPEEFGKYKM